MKKYFTKLIILLLLLPCLAGAVEIENPLQANNFWEILDALINFIFYISLPIATIMIIVAGFYFVTAAGQPAKIEIAKKMILWTLIGLLVIFCAKGLIAAMGDILGLKTPYNK